MTSACLNTNKTSVLTSCAEKGLAMPTAIGIAADSTVTIDGDELPTDAAENNAAYNIVGIDNYSAAQIVESWNLTAPAAGE